MSDEKPKLPGKSADRAHGPLERKVLFMIGPGWSHWNESVDALVKAAIEFDRYFRLAPPTAGLAMLVDDIRRCLKPFEVDRG